MFSSKIINIVIARFLISYLSVLPCDICFLMLCDSSTFSYLKKKKCSVTILCILCILCKVKEQTFPVLIFDFVIVNGCKISACNGTIFYKAVEQHVYMKLFLT